MRRVKSKDTQPEMIVRRLLHGLGYRYRLHRNDLPCKPDLVFASRKKVVFVHGCFWHSHDCKRGARMPKTNQQYWLNKLGGNQRRDKRCYKQLMTSGWKYLVIWECELKDLDSVTKRLTTFLGKPANAA